jgi:hypothetical protein
MGRRRRTPDACSEDWSDPLGRFPSALACFATRRILWWFLLLLLPPLGSAGAIYFHRGLATALFFFLMEVLLTSFLFLELRTGVSSSNWGTFDRRMQPVKYRLSVGWTIVFYIGFSIVGYAG